MFAQDLRVNRSWADAEALGQMHAKPQAVDIGSAAHNAIVSREAACNVRQHVGWVGDDHKHGSGSGVYDPRNNVFIDFSICSEQPQPTDRVIAVDCAAGLLVDTGGDHDEGRAGKILIIPVANIDR